MRAWRITRDRQIRVCHIELQPTRIRNYPDILKGQIRLATKLYFLSKSTSRVT